VSWRRRRAIAGLVEKRKSLRWGLFEAGESVPTLVGRTHTNQAALEVPERIHHGVEQVIEAFERPLENVFHGSLIISRFLREDRIGSARRLSRGRPYASAAPKSGV
jgi:hypothetical protein